MDFFPYRSFRQILSLVLCVLSVLCVPISAQNFKTLHDGVEYAQVEHKLGSEPVKINLLRLDLTKVRLDVHHAMDAAIGTEKTSSIATRHNAVAGINAGFFRLDNSIWAGENVGLLLIDYRLMSEPAQDRTSLLIANHDERTITGFGRPKGSLALNFFGYHLFTGINRELKDTDFVLYTSEFGVSTRTKPGVTEVILDNCRRSCGKIKVIDEAGDTEIPRGGYVISVGPKPTREHSELIEILKKNNSGGGMWLQLTDNTLVVGKKEYVPEDAVAGVPQLIKNGKIEITWEQEKASRSFVETRHPRTAVAKLKDGKFLMMTVDGRQPGVSVGMSLQELAEYLLSLGAVDAMNLDGGGSTTMFLDGKVVNTPSDKEGERKIGDAILVTLRKKASAKK